VQVIGMSAERSNRFNVLLDDEHAARLHRLAERTYVNPGTLARSLLSTALDQADPDPATITQLLDAIPGAWERAQEGVADVAAGRVIPVDEL
jgi:predicted transcriptional regulator